MSPPPATFHRPPLTDVAYQEIRNGILRGILPPGRKLVVNELVEEWKISNTPIKEALNRLVAEELVVALPRRGMQVRKFTAQETRDIFELRALLEIHCCQCAAGHGDDETNKELDRIMEDSAAALGRELDIHRLLDLDARFHQSIVQPCGNETLIREFNRLHAHAITLGSHISHNCSLSRWEETQREHDAVRTAIAARDQTAAAEAMRVHLEKTCQAHLSLLKAKARSTRRKSNNPLPATISS